MPRIIMTDSDIGQEFPLPAGDWTVTGTNSDDHIIATAGATIVLNGGAGNDIIEFPGSPSDYQVSALGSYVIFTSGGVEIARIALSGEDTVAFENGDSGAITIVGGAIMLGTQEVPRGTTDAPATPVDITGIEPVPTYALTSDMAAVDEGDAVTFTLTTTNVAEGTEVAVTFSGIDAADIDGDLPTVFTVGADGTATLTLNVKADAMTEGEETLTATAEGQTVSVAIADTSIETSPTYALAADMAAVDEGGAVTFTLTTTNVAEGTEVAVTFSGVDAADVDGDLPTVFTVGADGTATATVNIKADSLTEGEETLVATVEGESASVIVNDTSVAPTFTLTAASASINEGETNVFTVSSDIDLTEATTVTFQLRVDADGDSAQAADFNAGSFNPVTVTIPAGSKTATFNMSTITNDGTETTEKYTVQATIGTTVLTKQVSILDGSIGAGQTFTLTDKADVIPGLIGSNGNTVTSGNDIVIGIVEKGGTTTTLNASDVVDTGSGTDTLKIFASGNALTAGDVPVPTNVEIVELSAAAAATVNTSTWNGLTNLNVTKVGGALAATAGAGTDVNVTASAAGAAVGIDGGKAVAVSLSNIKNNAGADAITIGNTTAAKGTVTINATGTAVVDNGDVAFGKVTVKGGTTISVTQTATNDTAAAATGKTGTTYTQGDVDVIGDANTTTVNIKQSASVNEVLAVDAVAAKSTTQDVSFTAAKAGDHVTLDFNGGTAGSLKFVAAKDLTAAEVASAFANLSATALQGKAAASLGTYFDDTGVGVTNGWTSGEVMTVSATESKVVFSNTAAAPAANVTTTATKVGVGSTFSSTAAGAVAGTNAVPAVTGILGVKNGVVTILDTAATSIKTISVDGYKHGSRIGGDGANDDTKALETLSLANSEVTYAANKINAAAGVTIDDTAATLALTVEKLGASAYYNGDGAAITVEAAVMLTSAPTTLNVTSVGTNYVNLTDTGNTLQVLNVSGTGMFDADNNDLAALTTVKVSGTAGLKLNAAVNNTVTSVDTTGTTGPVTISINGDTATYAGGAGVDNVTVANPATAVSKSINLGDGNDTLTLTAGTPAIPTVTLEGGNGTDIIGLTAADAYTLSGNGNFEAKINGFEKLSLTKATTTGTVDLTNMDDISYVISANSDAGAATKEVFTADFSTSGAIVGADTILFDTQTTTLVGAESPTQIALAVAGKTYANWDVTSVAGAVVTFTAKVAGVKNDVVANDFTITDVENDGTLPVVTVAVTSQGAAAGTTGALTLDKMASGGTLELTGTGAGVNVKVTDATTGATDSLNIIANAATASNLGTVEVDKVEALKVTANDTDATTTAAGVANVSTNTLKIDADAVKTLTVDGAGHLDLTFTADSKAMTLIDGSTATGNLTIKSVAGDTAATTVKGGAGADNLTASGTADVLQGGAGDDILNVAAGAQTVTFTGGTGVDKFVVENFNAGIGSAVTITDFERGEQIQFDNAGTAKFVSARVTQISSATFTEWVTAAADIASDAGVGGVAWFQFTNGSETNTFIVQNNANDNTFNEGVDIIVQLTGAVDLSASSFNADTQGTLLYI